MPSTIPKPAETRRRRNKPVPTLNLPASGSVDDDLPEPIESLDDLERRYYEWAWTTPASAAWHWSDAEIVAEWARLKAFATRYMRGEVFKTTSAGVRIPADMPISLLGKITEREDRLLLSPVGRAKSHARIVEPEPERDGNVLTPGRWSKSA